MHYYIFFCDLTVIAGGGGGGVGVGVFGWGREGGLNVNIRSAKYKKQHLKPND